jgi:hypothetical protein
MSVENNQSRTIDGLNTIFCDVINIVESIEINGDNGQPNQIILSNGTRVDWGNISDLLQNLSVSSPLQFTTGTTYNGSLARTIEIPNLSIENAKLISSTISGVALGGVLSQLTLSNPLSFTTGSNYTGEAVRQITIANGAIDNEKLADSTISGVSLGDDLEDLTLGSGIIAIDVGTALPALEYNGRNNIAMAVKAGSGITVDGAGVSLTADTISGIQLGNNLPLLTANAPLSFVVGAEYNGQNARTLQISNIGNSDLQNSTISGVSLGSDLEALTAGDGLELNSGTTYNGGSAKTISLSPPYKTISDRVSYEDTGVGVERWLYTINAGDWRPNDDSTTYNIHIEDDSVALMGRAKAGISSLEAVAILQIPYDWSPAKIFIDCRDSAGNNLSRTYYLYKIYNWGDTGSTYLGSFTTNSETTIATSYGTGSSQYSLLVKMILTATTDHLGGGYITLTAPS